MRDLLAKTVSFIENECAHGGHASYCLAVRGPEGYTWVEDEMCNCGLVDLLDEIKKEMAGLA